ncbi:hypothetical protein BABINDRAFT_160947 [Babjeviella inositovora NRRL Y-12698]|uniref:GLC7-interacting protein 3 n=1 Tax=Babjeviella inositovora NRRL Y-12698 TaxID=984486 RepID=A0A1E3QUQ1_9ASCO|nr:uncharacterized protein BABINDRAFT_160947 [Babjeviella inositovora NRRL Y-12698]ODQ80722.1 hypothetical protein BABINDRAFT_160947 [Babjeviella inositovora NRRL Y-12698]
MSDPAASIQATPATATNPPATPPATPRTPHTAPTALPATSTIAELSGVSNGDVDWLVRVKSKKLQKKPKDDDAKDLTKRKPSGVDVSKIPAEVLAHPPTTPILPKDLSLPRKSALTTQLENQVAPVAAVVPTPALASAFSSGPVTPAPTAPTLAPALEARASIPPQSVPITQSVSISSAKSDTQTSRRLSVSIQAPSPPVASALSRSSSSGKRSFLSGLTSKFKSQPVEDPAPIPIPMTAAPASATTASPGGLLWRKMGKSPTNASPAQQAVSQKEIAKSFNQFFDVGGYIAPVKKVERRPSSSGAAPRRNSVASPVTVPLLPVASTPTTTRVVLNKNPNKLPPLPLDEIKDIKLRRVTFDLNSLASDPQQQIPSRNPRRGNVVIPLDFLEPPPRLNAGIVGRESKTEISPAPSAVLSPERKRELLMAQVAQAEAVQEAERHAHDANVAARKLADEVKKLNMKGSSAFNRLRLESQPGTSDDIVHDVSGFGIDGPIHHHENHFASENSTVYDDDEEGHVLQELPLDVIYTRCCHLREILPIPATLKQLKNKHRPLQVLKLLNPRPTLIDVLSFSDFISITPIHTIIFDNVTMTTEMLWIFLLSLVGSQHLEKLSLRNVAIDGEGWKFLCKFLSRNKSVTKLDISQQKVKAETPCTQHRAAMNWNLFINAMILRGGLAELVINGCRMTDEQFQLLIRHGVLIATQRLGIAQTELSVAKAQMLCEWIHDPEGDCHGLDVAFNDLSGGQLQPFIHLFSENTQLYFFSLNSTNITDVAEMSQLLESLAKVKTLRFLDLSSLPGLFPGILPALRKNLPLFADLRRIHFDLNKLSDLSIKAISEILPYCKTLINVSFIGNRDLSYDNIASLYTAVKLSNTIYTMDIDTDLVPEDLSKRIAFYLMKNMEKSVNRETTDLHAVFTEEELIFDGSLLTQSAERLLEYKPSETAGDDEETQRIITRALVERTRHMRSEIHKCIDDLFQKRTQGLLPLEGKETLLRFCLLDSSLEKIAAMFDEDGEMETDETEKIGTPKFALPPPHDHLHENSCEVIQSGPIVSPRMIQETNQTSYFAEITTTANSLAGKVLSGNILVPEHQPHQVVIDSDIPIDNATGMPVLIRSISLQSVQARRQEEEEGELHKFGFFMQSKDMELGEPANDESEAKPLAVDSTFIPLGVVPSGSELREAIIKAKGIDSVADLIHNIQHNRVRLDTLYPKDVAVNTPTPCEVCRNGRIRGDTESISSDDEVNREGCVCENDNYKAVVDETYNKLLQAVERVRSKPEVA